MIEFEQTRAAMNEAAQRSVQGFRHGFDSFREAEQQIDRMFSIREKMFQEALDQRGLAVCAKHRVNKEKSSSDFTISSEDLKLRTLGVYPRTEMRMYFSREYFDTGGGDCGRQGYRHEILLLCPDDYPKAGDRTEPARNFYGREVSTERPNLYSEVKEIEGRFVRSIDGEDITDLIPRLGYNDQHKGKIDPSDEIYRAFGIPDLPERPDFQNIKYGHYKEVQDTPLETTV